MIRRTGLAHKLLAVCLAFSLPIVVMFVLMMKVKLGDIEFASKEISGNAVQRPLEDVLQHISRHRRIWLRAAHGDASLGLALRAEELAIATALAHVVEADRVHGRELQFTPEGLGLRKRDDFTAARLREKWQALDAGLKVKDPESVQTGYLDVIAHVRTMITHAGDTSNLILDPDLDSYYLMDVTLLALPQMEDRLQQIAVDVEALAVAHRLTMEDRVRIAIEADLLKDVDWKRAEASATTALNEDQNFHGVSASLTPTLAPHVVAGGAAVARLLERLDALSVSGSMDGFDTAGFRVDLEAVDQEVYAFHRAAFDEEDALLRQRIAEIRASCYVGIALALAALVISSWLAYLLAADIVRRVLRIATATNALAKGDLEARVGASGADELGDLARSFDTMADRIGSLTVEVRERAAALAEVNENLEKTVEDRTGELRLRNEAFRLILDNAHDGMLTVDLKGGMFGERSAVVDRWFGTPRPGATFVEYICAGDAQLAMAFELGLSEVEADILPIELTIDQLPRNIVARDKHLRVVYQPIFEAGAVSRLLVILSDVTLEIEARRKSARQEELLRMFHASRRDPSGFLDFFVEVRDIMRQIGSGHEGSTGEIARLVHTLKGNCAMFGVLSISELCHTIETSMAESEGVMSSSDLARLHQAWQDVSAAVTQITSDGPDGRLELADAQYNAILDAIAGGAPRRDILLAIARWKLEPAERRLDRFAEQAFALAERQAKRVEVLVEANDVRLCVETWAPIWSALTHVIRNAIGHGIESPDERARAGKREMATLHLRARLRDERIHIEISDDGRGIAWDRVAARAHAANYPHSTRSELVEAIFTDGVSTAEVLTELSGRGVGMAAVRAACRELGGEVEIESEPGRGCLVRCSFPERLMGGKSMAAVNTRRIDRSIAPAACA